MDTDAIYQHGRARFEHAAARRLLKEKYQAKLLFAHAGGLWRAGPELITVLMACGEPQSVLLDTYENPVRVDVQAMLDLCRGHWQEQMNAWLVEHEQISSKR